MASDSKQTKAIRKHKHRAAGKTRKHAERRAQRVASEKKLEAALGERIPLTTLQA